MELKTEKREIDGLVFHITQFPARKSIKLEKRTITYLAPMLKMLEGFKSLDDEVDFSAIVCGIQDVLLNLNEDTLEHFIFAMLEYTSIVIKDGNGKEKITKLEADIFDIVFIGKNITVYKLILEIMKVNKFAFFALMGGGGDLTGIFSKMMPKQKKS